MIKTGKVSLGKTPSIVSGRPCEVIKHDEPVLRREPMREPELQKLAKVIGKVNSGK